MHLALTRQDVKERLVQGFRGVTSFRVSDGHPCKSLSREKHKIFLARSGERAIGLIRIHRYAVVPLGWWFLLSAEPDIHLLSETPKSPHRRLSLCSLPVPKQTDGSLGSCLRRSARHLRDLAACAPNDPDVLSFPGRFLRCRGASELLGRHEVLFSALDGEHVGDHLPGYGKRCPVLVPSLSFPLINQCQLMAVSRSQFRSLHQYLLNVLVPLLGDGHSNQLVGRAPLCAAESAIADGLLDRLEA